jgi:hypothetical protein
VNTVNASLEQRSLYGWIVSGCASQSVRTFYVCEDSARSDQGLLDNTICIIMRKYVYNLE